MIREEREHSPKELQKCPAGVRGEERTLDVRAPDAGAETLHLKAFLASVVLS